MTAQIYALLGNVYPGFSFLDILLLISVQILANK